MIKLFLTDLDGVLSDGCYFVFSQRDETCKQFHTRDFHGLKLLEDNGVQVGVITSSESSVTEKQFKRTLSDPICLVGIKDKVDTVNTQFIIPGHVKWDEIAFVGDDVMDLPLLERVGVAACPADAEIEVVDFIVEKKDGFLLEKNGGRACVREFINLILRFYDR